MRKLLLIPVAVVMLIASAYWVASATRQPTEFKELATPVISGSSVEGTVETGQSEASIRPSTPETPAENLNETELPSGCLTAGITQSTFDQSDHPLDCLLEVADSALARIDERVIDYSATLTSQARIGDELQPEKFLHCKIRHAGTTADGVQVPFSVYTKFLAPPEKAGQEAIWVQGWNQGNLVAHTIGIMNLKRFYLAPEGSLAMDGNLHPIQDIGFRNLIVKMQEVGVRDRNRGECEVNITRNLQINDRPCTMLEVIHPHRRPHFEFHIARIYLDDERNIPIAYEGYLWPEQPAEPAPLLEKYFYTDIQPNIGLEDSDFDPANEAYDYPAW